MVKISARCGKNYFLGERINMNTDTKAGKYKKWRAINISQVSLVPSME